MSANQSYRKSAGGRGAVTALVLAACFAAVATGVSLTRQFDFVRAGRPEYEPGATEVAVLQHSEQGCLADALRDGVGVAARRPHSPPLPPGEQNGDTLFDEVKYFSGCINHD